MSINPLDAIEPELVPQVSNLTLDQHRKFLSGQGETTSKPLSTESFLYKVIYTIPPTLLKKKETDTIKMVLLETYSIYKAYTNNQESFSNRISQEDVRRLIRNIRWVASRLEEYREPVLYDIIAGFRELDLLMNQFRNSSSLFSTDVSSDLKQFNEAGS